jgi:hypothetical protein
MTHVGVTEWAEYFWARARPEPFPRDLEIPVSWALPLAVIRLPRLTLASTRAWLHSRGICSPTGLPNRHLMACLVARAGRGFVLLDGTDPPDERRMSLAHEVAHFLLDYLAARERARAVMGEGADAVLDGQRPPTPEERLSGVLAGVRPGTYMHMMERAESGAVERLAVVEAEDRADRLALELLAPLQVVSAKLAGELPPNCATGAAVQIAASILVRDFGLPKVAAGRYAYWVVGRGRKPRSVRQWLGV